MSQPFERLPPINQYYTSQGIPRQAQQQQQQQQQQQPPPLPLQQQWQQGYQQPQPQAYATQQLPQSFIGYATAPAPSQYSLSPYVPFQDHESMVGKEGYPDPAREKVHKSRFTPEDDRLLRHLKEDYTDPKLSWKQIADFFPGRKSGTLQVRYCTKVKQKNEPPWTDEAKERLIVIMNEVESEYWNIVAERLRTGASAQSCEEVGTALRAQQQEDREQTTPNSNA